MRVPISIPVGGRDVKIVYVSKLEEGDRGAACLDTGRIFVSKSAPAAEREIFETIFHELIHVALHRTGHAEALDERQEEAIVYALEAMLAPLFVLGPVPGMRWRKVRFDFEEEGG